MVTEDGLMLLLTRIESQAIKASRNRVEYERERAARLRGEDALRVSESYRSRAEKDLAAAEKKICEWAEYAGQLRAAIDAVAPRAVRTKRVVLPDMPRPFETTIPF